LGRSSSLREEKQQGGFWEKKGVFKGILFKIRDDPYHTGVVLVMLNSWKKNCGV